MNDWSNEVRKRLAGLRLDPAEEARIGEELARRAEGRYQELLARGVPEEQAVRDTIAGLEREEMLGRVMGGAARTSAPEPAAPGRARGGGFLESRWSDIRYALRLLRRNPLYTAVIVLSLALGIGANTAVFSVVDAVLLQPPPFKDPDGLVMIWETDRNSDTRHEPASWPDIQDFRQRSRTVTAIGALTGMEATLATPGRDPERLSAVGVTPNLPSVLGVQPIAGRLFNAGEGAAGGAPVAILSERFWRSRFNGDRGIVGRTVVLNEKPTTVVGVLPAEASLGVEQIHAKADYSATYAGGEVQVWLALEPSADAFPRETHPFLTVGRLAPGTTAAAAQRELAGISADLEKSYPENKARGVNVASYTDVVFGDSRTPLMILLGAAALVLLVVCANVANLLLARMTARRRELAVRTALGAQGARISLQLLTESLVVTFFGAVAGVLLALAALKVLVAMAPASIPRLQSVSINGTVLAFTAAIAAVAAIAFGMVPVIHARRADIRTMLQDGGTRTSEGRGARRFRAGLVVSEVALAVALVIGAGLLLRSFRELRRVDPGFRTTGVLKAEYQLPETRYPVDFSTWPDLPKINNFHAELLRQVAAIPGVESAALAGVDPLDAGITNSFAIEGRAEESGAHPEIRTRFITPTYQRTLGVPIISGRAFRDGDDVKSARVAVINRAAAERYFKGADPIGQQISFWRVSWQIVGVMGDERFRGLDRESEPAVYVPLAQAPMAHATLLVRTRGEPESVVPAVRGVLRALDPQIALYGVEPLHETLLRKTAQSRFVTVLLMVFGGLAILLALVGLNGVLGYAVVQRAPELGIRMALGATSGDVLRMVVGEGVRLAALGVAIGAAAALFGSRLLSSLLYGVSGTDALTYVAVALGALGAAAVASWLPARRATSIEPNQVLRME
ncbi:MAG TPA: ABC transporter permease [Longimicrobium sp.]